ncbi:MAG TPA: tyrosine/phenylalanine carboxypeptidase domain-containing protein [Candidatus Saccharimonadales bacterium]|nr:tyrosine/phenylalanine carboxypeptidase domain-containing protein [Candidatus Saccharimonadales bacterium]
MPKPVKILEENQAKILRGGPLVYLNFPRSYRLSAYDFLINSAPLPPYKPNFDAQTLEIIDHYQNGTADLLNRAENEKNARLARRLAEVALIKSYRDMYAGRGPADFKKAVTAVWGQPSRELFWELVDQALAQAGKPSRDAAVLAEVKKLINIKPADQTATWIHISPKLFKPARAEFKELFKPEVDMLNRALADKPPVHRYNYQEVIELLRQAMVFYGLDKDGWQIVISDKTEKVMVNYDTKSISVSRGSLRLSKNRMIGLVLHEVFVHAKAKPHIRAHAGKIGERRVVEEGLGIFIEQMALRRFYPVRSLRYISLGLALGLDGKPRNAREVYEIIWRLRYLGGSAKSRRVAKEYAAKEVVRTFRGMPLAQRGVVITKDRAYVEGNRMIWAYLADHGPKIIFSQLLGKK